MTTADCAEVFLDFVADRRFSPDLTMLSDTSQLTSVHASFRGILTRLLSMQRALAAFPEPALSVIYARSDTIYGMARMLEQTLSPLSKVKIVVVKDQAAALKLAGQPEADFPALHDALNVPRKDAPPDRDRMR
ncbi:hypothetical protein [Tropicibacter oceani]|uniref:Uncharacterized protein n=1 Tax=Tropicibacter oceani TaxID=3058420 RepID=A0ABY8QEH0_9RHOB|nr:hypothetical protein [Tropicibacter oceani]WGW03020.1 hypothetical protein QF118_13910 [Tropicibacter oceani]